MDSILRTDCSVDIIGCMWPGELAQFAASFQAAAAEARTFKAVHAFACTRPGAGVSIDFDIKKWKKIWKSCAQTVVACGLQPSVWARSVCSMWLSCSNTHYQLERRRLDCFQFLWLLMEMSQDESNPDFERVNASVSAVLMVKAEHQEYLSDGERRDAGHALVALSDGRLAFMFWYAEGSDIVGLRDHFAAVYVETSLQALLKLVSSASGEGCDLVVGDDGTLELSCNVEYQEIHWDLDHGDYWGTGVDTNDNQSEQLQRCLLCPACFEERPQESVQSLMAPREIQRLL